MEKVLMSIKEVCEYTGWGSDSDFTIRVGNRLYVNKKLFDDYLVKCAKNKTDI